MRKFSFRIFASPLLRGQNRPLFLLALGRSCSLPPSSLTSILLYTPGLAVFPPRGAHKRATDKAPLCHLSFELAMSEARELRQMDNLDIEKTRDDEQAEKPSGEAQELQVGRWRRQRAWLTPSVPGDRNCALQRQCGCYGEHLRPSSATAHTFADRARVEAAPPRR